MAKSAKRRGYSYRVTDLNYPAVTVKKPINAFGAKLGGAKAFAFGKSVAQGVTVLKQYYLNISTSCPETKWVLAGYSQGALVVTQAVVNFKAARVLYVGTFGDPWLYLPEGKGLLPKACRGRGLSSYRIFAPECKTYTGSIGASNPYVPASLEGKYGLWCNRHDYICGSSRLLFDNSGHTKYVEYNEFSWMASIVERKLPWRSSTNETSNVEDEDIEDIEDVIEAHLSTDEYLLSMGGKVLFDASSSFSMGHEITEYWWSFDGEEYWTSGTESTLEREFFFPEQHTLRLKVVDDAGNYAETSARVVTYEGEPEDNTMTAPKYVTAKYANREIEINWTTVKHYRAKYLLARLNGVDLDYMPVGELSGTIDGIEDGVELKLQVAWLDENFEVGEWAEVEIERGEPVEPINIEPVQTGVAETSSALLLMIGLVGVVLAINKKYLPH